MAGTFKIGDRVEIFLDEKFGDKQGWHAGTIFKIDPYSEHRSFYWVRFDEQVASILGMNQISILNPKNIKLESA